MQQQPPNELQIDDQWQHGVFDRLLAPVLRAGAYRNQVVFVPFGSPVSKMLQLRAGVDVLAQMPHGGMLGIEVKIVRFPGIRSGRPARYHWPDLFLETWSSQTYGSKGWMHTSQADILLWCQCAADERSLNCWPFNFSRLRTWFMRHIEKLPERKVPNVIEGRELWSVGRLANIQKVVRDLKIEGFRVDAGELVCDLWGKPILGFLSGEEAAE